MSAIASSAANEVFGGLSDLTVTVIECPLQSCLDFGSGERCQRNDGSAAHRGPILGGGQHGREALGISKCPQRSHGRLATDGHLMVDGQPGQPAHHILCATSSLAQGERRCLDDQVVRIIEHVDQADFEPVDRELDPPAPNVTIGIGQSGFQAGRCQRTHAGQTAEPKDAEMRVRALDSLIEDSVIAGESRPDHRLGNQVAQVVFGSAERHSGQRALTSGEPGMSHIVVYQTDDGSSGFEQCASLDDAIVVAERMRNVDGVESPRIFRMEEIEIDFRPYYRVQVAGAEAASTELDDLPAPPSAEAVAAAEAETGAPVTSDAPTWSHTSEDEATEESDSETAQEVVAEEHDDDHDDDHEHAEDPDHGHAEDHGHGHAEDHGHGEDSQDGEDHESSPEMSDAPSPDNPPEDSSDDDAMISVRRGLFGR